MFHWLYPESRFVLKFPSLLCFLGNFCQDMCQYLSNMFRVFLDNFFVMLSWRFSVCYAWYRLKHGFTYCCHFFAFGCDKNTFRLQHLTCWWRISFRISFSTNFNIFAGECGKLSWTRFSALYSADRGDYGDLVLS